MTPRHSSIGISSLVAAACLTGCGQGLKGLTPQGQPLGLEALAGAPIPRLQDLPTIAAQLQAAGGQETERGTWVKKLPKPGVAKAYTFMSYKALDNNLGLTLPMHLNVLERAGSSTRTNALVFADDVGPKNTGRYYIRQDQDDQKLTSPFVPAGTGGESDTGSSRTLASAVRWAAKDYPAQTLWVDLNNHGGGYYGFGQDDDKESIMRLPDLAKGLAGAGRPIDVLSFDACLMATVEVAYELRGVARYMVASEDASYALGMNYDQVLGRLGSGALEANGEGLAREIVVRAQRKGPQVALFTISALDNSKAEGTTQRVDALAAALSKALPTQREAILRAFKAVKPFHVAGPDASDFDHRDLNEVVDQLRLRVQDQGVKAAAEAVKATLFNKNGLILFSRAAKEEGGVPRGVSIYLPTERQVDPLYRGTSFAKATRWDEFLVQLVGEASAKP